MLEALGEGEGEVNILAWPGYAEDGSNDPEVDWVTPFEKETGCQANVKTSAPPTRRVNLMKTGEYDVVSASGDASLRLIAAGDVAPVNTDLIPNYADIYAVPQGPGLELGRRPDVRRPARLGRQPADVPHRRGQAGADQLERRVRRRLDVRGQGHGVRLADLHRRRRAVPDEDPAGPGHQEPVRAGREPARGGGRPAQGSSSEHVGEYWSDYLKEIQAFKTGDSVVGTTWQVIVNVAQGEKVPVEAILPEEGSTGWSDTWMVAAEVRAPELRVHVDGLHHQPRGERRRWPSTSVRRRPTRRRATLTADKTFCETYHAGDEDVRREDLVLDHADRAVPGRPHGRQVHRLRRLDPGLDRDQGLIR